MSAERGQGEWNNCAKLFLQRDPNQQQMSTSPGISRFASVIILGQDGQTPAWEPCLASPRLTHHPAAWEHQ